tara:strand:+ start:276 stop:653 length:378 start_codon:yes stop_codon:yes gene_type:complete
MIQHRGSLNNIFINNACKLKNEQGETQLHFVLNLNKTCVYFSEQKNNKNIYLKKPVLIFINKPGFLLTVLLIDFIIFTRQKLLKTAVLYAKILLKKEQSISNKESVFIKNTACFFTITNVKTIKK